MGLFFNRGAGSAPVDARSTSDLWTDQVFRRITPNTGIRVDQHTALTHSAVYGCVDLIADIVSTFPAHRYKENAKGGKTMLPKKDTIIDSPSEIFDDVNWRRLIVICWLLRGYAAGLVTKKMVKNRRPTAEKIELIHPDRVTFYRARPDDPIEYRLDGHKTALWPRGKLWIGNGKMMNPNDPVGRSVIEFASSDIGLGLHARKFGKDWFAGGGHPTSLLRNDKSISKVLPEGMTAEDGARRIRERFLSSLHTGEPVVLSDGWDYEAIQIKPDESQFLDTINANQVLICNFFRVPPSLFGASSGDGGAITYTNMEDKGLDLLKFTMQPWVTRMEKVLNTLLPDNEFIKLNLDALLRTDTKRRYETYTSAVKTGWFNNNEVRELEDLEPVQGLDQYLWPPNRANMSLEEMAGDPDEGENDPINPPTLTVPKPNKNLVGAAEAEAEAEAETPKEEAPKEDPKKKKDKK